MSAAVYLDYNATAPLKPEIITRMGEIMAAPRNPSSVHRYGREARKLIEDARKTIAECISVFPRDIAFTGSATEANNWALTAFPARKLIVSAVEHSSVLKAREHPTLCPVDANGVIDLAVLDRLLADAAAPALVSVMLANNETGVIQPIAEVKAVCAKHEALLHCDAVQGLGKIPVDAGLLGADMMTITSHKCGGPVGAAALVIRSDLAVSAFHKGGGQELNRRAGTENVAAIAGFALATELAQDFAHMQQLRRHLDALEADLPEAIIFGKNAARLPNTSCIGMQAATQEVQLMHFDLAGIAISAGSACSSGRIEPSHVLTAMGVNPALSGAATRVSGGWATAPADIGAFAKAWKILYSRAGEQKHLPAA